MAHNSSSQSSNKTSILVNSAVHGVWRLEKVIPLLKAKGYKIIALDLPSSGDDTAKFGNIILVDVVMRVREAANVIDRKAILLGHLSGGVVTSEAAELLGSKKLDKLIYMDAFLHQNGESVFFLIEKIRETNKVSSVSESDASPPELLIFSQDKKSCKWPPELAHQLFYHDCSPEDIAFAKARLSWQSVATRATPVHATDSSVIKKYYILCTQAKDSDKSIIVSNFHCEAGYKRPSSHSAFC